MTLISHRRYTQPLFIICNNPTPRAISTEARRRKTKKGKIMSQVNNEIYAAISMALYELQGAMMHDDEPGIITIKPRQTAWKTPQQIILSR